MWARWGQAGPREDSLGPHLLSYPFSQARTQEGDVISVPHLVGLPAEPHFTHTSDTCRTGPQENDRTAWTNTASPSCLASNPELNIPMLQELLLYHVRLHRMPLCSQDRGSQDILSAFGLLPARRIWPCPSIPHSHHSAHQRSLGPRGISRDFPSRVICF